MNVPKFLLSPAVPGQQVGPSALTLQQMMQSPPNNSTGGQFHPLSLNNDVENR